MGDGYDIMIIGGGASGLVAACSAAHTAHAAGKELSIVIVEMKDRIGQKIMATGNGRCNLSNTDLDIKHYHSHALPVVSRVLSQNGLTETLAFFQRLGLMVTEEEGRIYPYSQHASAVLDVLRHETAHYGIETCVGTRVDRLTFDKNANRFTAWRGKDSTVSAKKAIVTVGGDCANDGLLSAMGHRIIKRYPALVPLVVDYPYIKSLKGIRVDASLTLYADKTDLASARGELLFTEYGLSGIPAMQVSGSVHGYTKVTAKIDFVPDKSYDDLLSYLYVRRQMLKHLCTAHFFMGMLHKRMGHAMLCTVVNDNMNGYIKDITDKQLTALAVALKQFRIPVSGTRGFSHAQVTGGGADLSQFDPTTLQSKLIPGLFAAGETLDVFGDCGGYNLQWAWSSGMIVGPSAAVCVLAGE